MHITKRSLKFYTFSFLRHDFRASITVFFVALPLCLGVSLASNAPLVSGLLAGILGGVVVTALSNSALSVSGPAAGLTTICAAAILQLGSYEAFAVAVALSGLIQISLGLFRLGGFTHLIPSSVIKGMLAAIGIILISKQIPMVIGYGAPDFWQNQLLNIITFNHAFQHIDGLLQQSSKGVVFTAIISLLALIAWSKYFSKKVPFVPTSFVIVVSGCLTAAFFNRFVPALQLDPIHFVSIPSNVLEQVTFQNLGLIWGRPEIWQTALIICFVASLETLLSIEAIDKLDSGNRVTPQNRELIAQGVGNFTSGLLGGLPITAVIVRSSANAEAGAKTKMSAFAHGIWLLLALAFAIPFISHIPYAVLAVILIQTGYNLAKPKMIVSTYRQGREQFLPFIITVGAILFTDLLIGVLIGLGYSIYFLIKHTYRAGFTMETKNEGHIAHYTMDLALNVSFLNKRKITETLDRLPEYSVVEINGAGSVYIDHDILEIFQSFRSKAKKRHIQLILKDIPEVDIIEVH